MADTPAQAPKRRRAAPKAAAGDKTSKPRATRAKAAAASAATEEKKVPAPRKRAAAARKPAAAKATGTAGAAKAAATRKPRQAKAAPSPSPAPRAREDRPGSEAVRANAGGLAAAIGTLALAGGAFFLWRTTRAEEPPFQVLESDGPFELRRYEPMVTAGTEHPGERRAALEAGFRTLADYIFAKSRGGDKIPMTAPVLADTDRDGSWRTRFVMPTGRARATLPQPPAGVELEVQPGARVAAVRFGGNADDALLNAKEGALRTWLQSRGYPHEAKAVHAFYNAPFMPGPFRRNEVLITVSSEGGTGT